MRINILVEYYANLNHAMRANEIQSNNKIMKEQAQKSRNVLVWLAEIMLPSIPRCENEDVIFLARQSPQVIHMIRLFVRNSFSKPRANFELIAQYLLFSELAGNVSSEASRMYNILKSEAKKRTVDETCDSRYALTLSFMFESSLSINHNVPLGHFFYSIQMLFKSLSDDWHNGGLYQCLGTSPPFVSQQDGCYSPSSLIRIMEKTFVLLLCHMKRFRDVILPSALAKDILLKPKEAYGSCVNSYTTITSSDREDPLHTRAYESRRMLLYGSRCLMVLMLEVLKILSFHSFSRWEKVNNQYADQQSIRNSMHSFTVRISVLLITLATNLNGKTSDKNFIAQIMSGIGKFNSKRKKDGNYALPHVYDAFLLRDMTVSNHRLRFTEFCYTYDKNNLICLSCDPSAFELPPYLLSLKISRKILDVSNENYVTISDPQKRDVCEDHIAPNESVPLLSDVLSPDVDDSSSSDMNNPIIMHAPPSRLKTLEERLHTWHLRLLRRLEEAKTRIALYTPLDICIRRVEKEFLIAGVARCHAELATTVLCPLSVQLTAIHERLDRYISDEVGAWCFNLCMFDKL